MIESTVGISGDIQKFYGDKITPRVGDIPFKVDDFEPFPRHVLVKEVEPDERSKGGIFLPDDARSKTNLGLVVKVSSMDKSKPGYGGNINLEEGDFVLFQPGSGVDVTIAAQKFIVLQYHSTEEGEILGWFKKPVESPSDSVVK